MPSAVRPYIPWNLLNMPAGIVPITKVTERDDSELISLPNNDMVNSFSIFLHIVRFIARDFTNVSYLLLTARASSSPTNGFFSGAFLIFFCLFHHVFKFVSFHVNLRIFSSFWSFFVFSSITLQVLGLSLKVSIRLLSLLLRVHSVNGSSVKGEVPLWEAPNPGISQLGDLQVQGDPTETRGSHLG